MFAHQQLQGRKCGKIVQRLHGTNITKSDLVRNDLLYTKAVRFIAMFLFIKMK